MRKFYRGRPKSSQVKKDSSGKIRNATKVEYNGIKFKSKLECFAYKHLTEANFNVKYEECTYTLVPNFEYNGEKIRPMTFTPDFVSDDYNFVMETKGYANESFPLRWKLFKRHLKDNNLTYKLYLPRTQKQVLECIEDILKTKI